jgi:ADP-ribosylation factor-like protein 1
VQKIADLIGETVRFSLSTTQPLILIDYILVVNSVDGLIYVIDSTDVDRLPTAHDQLHTYLDVLESEGVPVLVWANKQDLPNAIKHAEITERMGMGRIPEGQWRVQECQVRSGEGLFEGLEWIAQASGRKWA